MIPLDLVEGVDLFQRAVTGAPVSSVFFGHGVSGCVVVGGGDAHVTGAVGLSETEGAEEVRHF